MVHTIELPHELYNIGYFSIKPYFLPVDLATSSNGKPNKFTVGLECFLFNGLLFISLYRLQFQLPDTCSMAVTHKLQLSPRLRVVSRAKCCVITQRVKHH